MDDSTSAGTAHISLRSNDSVFSGQDCRVGLVSDRGNLNTGPEAFWSAMCVLLSRATRMEDLLLLRCPPKSFFDAGPPAYLKSFLQKLHGGDGELSAGRQKGDELIEKYDWRVPSELLPVRAECS